MNIINSSLNESRLWCSSCEFICLIAEFLTDPLIEKLDENMTARQRPLNLKTYVSYFCRHPAGAFSSFIHYFHGFRFASPEAIVRHPLRGFLYWEPSNSVAEQLARLGEMLGYCFFRFISKYLYYQLILQTKKANSFLSTN